MVKMMEDDAHFPLNIEMKKYSDTSLWWGLECNCGWLISGYDTLAGYMYEYGKHYAKEQANG